MAEDTEIHEPPVEDEVTEDTPKPEQSEEPEKSDKTDKETDSKPKKGIKAKLSSFKAYYLSHKKFSIPLTILVLSLIILIIPWTRYKVLGLFISKSFTVTVVDSSTNGVVSGAKVTLGSLQATTNGSGKATINSPVGDQSMSVSKQYYKTSTSDVLVSLDSSANTAKVKLVATGRQVPVTVIDKITKKGVKGVKIVVLDTEATTDDEGKAVLVIPANAATQKVTLTSGNYKTLEGAVVVTDKTVALNTFSLIPNGTIYFLSNANGTIDVVKTDLDGSNRKVVLSGTGKEDKSQTALLATRDWKYLALLSKRDGGASAKLFLINTTNNDKVTTFDEGNVDFVLSGWSNHTFVYRVYRKSSTQGQAKAYALKSFNADSGNLATLDETNAETNGSAWLSETYEKVYLIDNSAFYTKNWQGNALMLPFTKSATLNSVNVNGGDKKTVKTFTYPTTVTASGTYLGSRLYEPKSIYLLFSDGTDYFYEYENGSVKSVNITSDDFYNDPYPTYLESPTSKQAFWSEPRDGKNTLFIGDSEGKNKKQIAALSEYLPYGWYSNDYLLVSKDSSELYIMSPDTTKTPIKVTDYYKPALNFLGYGGGYGGL